MLKRELEDGDKERKALLQQAKMDDIAALISEISTLENQVASHQKTSDALRASVDTCRDQLEEARRIEAIFKESTEAKQAHEALLTKKTVIDADRSILAIAEKAALLSDSEKFLEDRRSALNTYKERAEEARAECINARNLVEKAATVFQEEEAREPARNAARTKFERLSALMDSTEQRKQIFRDAQTAVEQLGAKEKQLNLLSVQIQTQGTQIETLKSTLEATKTAAALARQLEATLTRIEQARADLGSLARSLKDGEPCPVCGSPNHPRPALDHVPSEDPQMDEYRLQLEGAQETANQQDTIEQRLHTANAQAEHTVKEHAALSAQCEVLRNTKAETAVRLQLMLDELPESLRAPGALETAHAQAKSAMDALNKALT